MEVYKHFLWTIPGPDSSYSSLVIHIAWKVLKEERIDPPIHALNFLSGGATILTFIEAGAKEDISLANRSSIPENYRDEDMKRNKKEREKYNIPS